MNQTDVNDVINSSAVSQTQPLASDSSSDIKTLSRVVRVFNGIIIPILFTIGLGANLVVLHVLRRKGILLKNTTVVLANVMITDLISVLVILPHDFAFFVLEVTLPRANEVLKIRFAITNALIFLNCSLTMALTIERTKTATFLGQIKGDRLSQALTLSLAAIWLSSLGEAAFRYHAFSNNVQLPWTFSGQAVSAISGGPSAEVIIVMVLVLAAALVILVSLYLMSFFRRLNEDSEQTFQGFFKRKRRCKIHKQITVACLATLATLAVSYVPLITAILIWRSLGRQSSNPNVVAHVLCSVALVINPIIAIAMSGRVQRAFMSVLRVV